MVNAPVEIEKEVAFELNTGLQMPACFVMQVSHSFVGYISHEKNSEIVRVLIGRW